jgi:hypothetical protein
MGCCLVALASWISPRLALFLVWLFSDRLDFAFESFWMGFLGFLILPWTTLFYALAYAPIAGVEGIGWVFVAFGLFLDIASWSSGGREGRNYQRDRART